MNGISWKYNEGFELARSRSATALPADGVEPLEPRLLMSTAPAALVGDEPLSTGLSPSWFEDLVPNSRNTVASESATLADHLVIKTIKWRGQQVQAAVNQWLIQLSDFAIAQVSAVQEVDQMLNLGPLGGRLLRGLGSPGQVLIEAATSSRKIVVQAMKESDLVASIEPNLLIQVQTTPDDTKFDEQWALHNIGQAGGRSDADIDAPEAWDITTGRSDVVVAVIDTGIDFNHPDLKENMWVNPGEIDGNGIDDDHNGFIDDVHGYDFANNDGNPMDDNGHGTHVAGIISAVGDNNRGATGVSWGSSLMGIKFLNKNGSGFTSNAVRAINYATMMNQQYDVNIRVLNNSWGGRGSYSSLRSAIVAAKEADMLFVVAAGNAGSNNDDSPEYPANYNVDNVISVAATNSRDRLTGFSNYGPNTVHLAAPGQSIYNTYKSGGYRYFSGTSMASPHVAGVAALAWSFKPNASYDQVRDAIVSSVDKIDSLDDLIFSGGRLNAYATLRAMDSGGSYPVNPEDKYENNDTPQIVDQRNVGSTLSPNLGLLHAKKTIYNLNFSDDPVDWFKFSMNATGGSSNEVWVESIGGQLGLAVYRGDQLELVDEADRSLDTLRVSLEDQPAGAYYVKVFTNKSDDDIRYTMNINPIFNIGDAYEENDSLTETDAHQKGVANSSNFGYINGRRIIENLNMLDDANDWYRFETSQVGQQGNHVRIVFNHFAGDLDLGLYESDGVTRVHRSESVVNSERVSLKKLPAGIYYVRVYGYRGAKNPNYKLAIDLSVKMPDDLAGNTFGVARQVGAIDRVHRFSDFVGSTDQKDFYHFNVSSRSNIALNLNASQKKLRMKVFDNRGKLMYRATTQQNTSTIISQQFERGAYYTLVSSNHRIFSDYTLKISNQTRQQRGNITFSKNNSQTYLTQFVSQFGAAIFGMVSASNSVPNGAMKIQNHFSKISEGQKILNFAAS